MDDETGKATILDVDGADSIFSSAERIRGWSLNSLTPRSDVLGDSISFRRECHWGFLVVGASHVPLSSPQQPEICALHPGFNPIVLAAQQV
jgi:hypothetical protein